MYTDVNVSDNQKQKIRNALAAGTQLSLRLSHEDIVGNDVIAVTQSQLNRLKKAHQAGKGVTIKMSKSQVAHNMKVQGGFLLLLAGLTSQALPFLTGTVLPALGVGALSGLASTGVQKLVGNGLYIKKGGCVCEVETDGSGLYLKPTTGKGFSKLGDGLYLKKGHIYDGKSLLLGPNSPFKIFLSSVCYSTGVQNLVGISRKVDVYARLKRTDGHCT